MADVALEGTESSNSSRIKFLIGGLIILAAVGYLIWTGFSSSAQYFLTVEELRAKGLTRPREMLSVRCRLSGLHDGTFKFGENFETPDRYVFCIANGFHQHI